MNIFNINKTIINNVMLIVRVSHWLEQIKLYASESAMTILVGTKIDLAADRTVPFEVAATYARFKGLPYFEVSSVTGEGVDGLVKFAVKKRLKGLNLHSYSKSKATKPKLNCEIS